MREALDARSDAIVMPMPHRRPSGKVLSKTLEVVLGKRPCRVIIDSAPARPLRDAERSGSPRAGARPDARLVRALRRGCFNRRG